MEVNRKKFLEKLLEVAERELELAEMGIIRVGEERAVKFPPEHRIIEELLSMLGYGGKRVYVRSLQKRTSKLLSEIIEQIIISDYQRGLDIYNRAYLYILLKKAEGLNYKISKKKIRKILLETRKKLKSSKNSG